jgi:hypothetical protein
MNKSKNKTRRMKTTGQMRIKKIRRKKRKKSLEIIWFGRIISK